MQSEMDQLRLDQVKSIAALAALESQLSEMDARNHQLLSELSEAASQSELTKVELQGQLSELRSQLDEMQATVNQNNLEISNSLETNQSLQTQLEDAATAKALVTLFVSSLTDIIHLWISFTYLG